MMWIWLYVGAIVVIVGIMLISANDDINKQIRSAQYEQDLNRAHHSRLADADREPARHGHSSETRD